MDTLDELRIAMVATPDEQTPRDMFLDELMQQSGLGRAEAEAEANKAWIPALQCQHINQAIALLVGRAAPARRLQWLILKALPPGTPASMRIILTKGYGEPVRQLRYSTWSRQYGSDMFGVIPYDPTQGQERLTDRTRVVTVGAMWVLLVACEWKFLDRDPTPEPVESDDE